MKILPQPGWVFRGTGGGANLKVVLEDVSAWGLWWQVEWELGLGVSPANPSFFLRDVHDVSSQTLFHP